MTVEHCTDQHAPEPRVVEKLTGLEPAEIRRLAVVLESLSWLQEEYEALVLLTPEADGGHWLTLLRSLNRQFQGQIDVLCEMDLLP